MIDLFVFTFRICLLALAFLLAGFLVFWVAMPAPVPVQDVTGQAIIVVTGGQGRVAAGLGLLESGRAPQLFISGVGQGATVADVVREAGGMTHPELMRCCITLGYQAKNTNENASEVAAWLKAGKINQVILVSSNYHLARAQLELMMAAPGLEIDLFPTDTQSLTEWWKDRWKTELMVGEYLKTVWTLGRYLSSKVGH